MLCLEVVLTESQCRRSVYLTESPSRRSVAFTEGSVAFTEGSVAFINYWFHLIKIKYLNLSDQNNRHKSP